MNDKYLKSIKHCIYGSHYNEDYQYEMVDYFDKIQQENKEYIKVIDKIDKKINDFIKCCKAEKIESGSDFLHHSYWNMFENFNKQIKEILKEVKE